MYGWTTDCFAASVWVGGWVDVRLDTRLLVPERPLCGFALDGSGERLRLHRTPFIRPSVRPSFFRIVLEQ